MPASTSPRLVDLDDPRGVGAEHAGDGRAGVVELGEEARRGRCRAPAGRARTCAAGGRRGPASACSGDDVVGDVAAGEDGAADERVALRAAEDLPPAGDGAVGAHRPDPGVLRRAAAASARRSAAAAAAGRRRGSAAKPAAPTISSIVMPRLRRTAWFAYWMIPTSSMTSTKSDEPSSSASEPALRRAQRGLDLDAGRCARRSPRRPPGRRRPRPPPTAAARRSTTTASTPSKCPPAPSGTIIAARGEVGSARQPVTHVRRLASSSSMSSTINGSRSGSLASISA